MELRDSTSTPSVTWHLVWQAVEGRDFLASEALAERIRTRVIDAHRAPGRALLHFLITPTELHLLSRLPAAASPRDVARVTGNIVARWVRQAQGRPGLVFAGRFRAYPIAPDAAVRHEFRMLAWRPVLLGLCRVPSHDVHSSLRALLGSSENRRFDVRNAHRLFGDTLPQARAALRATIGERPDAVEVRQWELSCGILLAPGAAGTFSAATRAVDGLAAALVAASRPQGIDGALALLERWVRLKLGRSDLADLAAASSPASARARALVACLAVALDLGSAASVARHFGRAKSTLSERMAACRTLPEDAAILALPLSRVVEEAIALAAGPPPAAT